MSSASRASARRRQVLSPRFGTAPALNSSICSLNLVTQTSATWACFAPNSAPCGFRPQCGEMTADGVLRIQPEGFRRTYGGVLFAPEAVGVRRPHSPRHSSAISAAARDFHQTPKFLCHDLEKEIHYRTDRVAPALSHCSSLKPVKRVFEPLPSCFSSTAKFDF